MNQKRITNQNLELKNFTLNSTLNYLFNISNMKKLFSYLLISSMVILSSCTNYDDQFDDLNTQINTLKSQIDGFSSLSSGLTALQGTVSSLQSAVAALPKTATPATDISGLETSVAALQASLASASTSAEVAAISTELAAAQTALANAIAANATAIATADAASDANATSIAGNATAIAALQVALDKVSATLATMQTTLASAATAADITALNAELDLLQADLTELLEANKIYTGNVIISNNATLVAAEQLGDKIGIINGGVDVTQNATVDLTRLSAVLAKIKTVTGAVTLTHALTAVAPASFTALTSVGSISIKQVGDISLPVLASAGDVTLDATSAKVTSISAPKLVSVTSFKSNAIGSTNVTSIDLSSLESYPKTSLSVSLKTTGNTTLSLPAFAQLNASTGLPANLDFTLTGGDDLSLPVYQGVGFITATNVSALSLPKFQSSGTFTGSGTAVTTAGSINVANAKLKTIAIHNVRNSIALGGAKLESVDVIGVTNPAIAKPTTLLSNLTISGSSPNLTTVSVAGKFKTVSITGATDIATLTTAGMIQSFTLEDTEEMTELTLGHAGLSGFGTSELNDTNRGVLVIKDNLALTSFTASSVKHLGTLTITGNTALTAFTLPSTLAVGTRTTNGSTATTEELSVSISGNKLSGTAQLASEYNASSAVAGKIVQASLNNISAFLIAAEAAITSPAVITSGDVTDGWSYQTGVYSETNGNQTTAYGAKATTYSSVAVDVKMDTAVQTTAAGVATDQTAYSVIGVTTPGVAGVPAVEAQARETITFAPGTTVTIGANGGSKQFDLSTDALLTAMESDPLWASYGVSADTFTTANARTLVTVSGAYSPSAKVTLSWGPAGAYTVSHTVVATDTTSIAAALVTEFNNYQTATISRTTPAQAVNTGGVITIMSGTYSGTAIELAPNHSAYFTGITATVSASTGGALEAVAVSQTKDYGVIITARNSATGSFSTSSTLAVTGGTGVGVNGGAHPIMGASGKSKTSSEYQDDYSLTAAVAATGANLTKRALWLK